MWLVRISGKLFKLGVMAYFALTGVMLIWTFAWPEPEMDDFRAADAIVCLGGGMSANGTLANPVLTRIERCVQLFEAGRAPMVVFTGGTAVVDGPNAGTQMALYAESLGVPEDAIVIEGHAQSTLQNALFSLKLTPHAQDVILVTEAFHLPRSWASFKWAAWETGHGSLGVALAMSEKVRHDTAGKVGWNILVRESMAIWFNALRATFYSVAPDRDVNWLH